MEPIKTDLWNRSWVEGFQSISQFGSNWVICRLHNHLVSTACYYLFLVVAACRCLWLLVVNSRQKQELQQGVNLELLSQFPTHFKQSHKNVNNQLLSFLWPKPAFQLQKGKSFTTKLDYSPNYWLQSMFWTQVF